MFDKWEYGSLGNGWLFWKRLFCHHEFYDCDDNIDYLMQQCGKCGLYRYKRL